MEVNKILKLSATMLQMKDVEEVFRYNETIEEFQNDDLELLVSCVNLVCSAIATDYIPLTRTKVVDNNKGVVSFAEITDRQIYKVLKVLDNYGQKMPFKITSEGIECGKGNVEIIFSCFPKDYSYNDVIDDFYADLTERVVAMGVVSEYLYIRGNSDDASIWESRFKTAMRNIVRPRKEVVLHKRRWW
ncbi:MAG: hypothetical protein E7361_00260 [Clostridiales bacterium]|nr:hypothetical protein [Clostridiales bacterium]